MLPKSAASRVAAGVDLGVRTALRFLALLLLLILAGAVCYAMMTSARMFSQAIESSRQRVKSPASLRWIHNRFGAATQDSEAIREVALT